MLNPRQFSDIAAQTRQPDTGATVNVRTGAFLNKGWAVAVPGHEHVEPTQSYGPKTLSRYIRTHGAALEPEGRHLGIWHDRREGAAYLDVSRVRPETYQGGVQSLADAYRGAEGLEGPGHQERSIYRMGEGHTLFTRPGVKKERRQTAQAMKALRQQQPRAKSVVDMPTGGLAAAIRNRRQVS